MYFTFLLLLVFVTNANFEQVSPTDVNSYGPYDLSLTYYGLCPGVQLRRTSVTAYNENNDVITNVTLQHSLQVESIKILVYKVTNGKQNLLYKYLLKKPCQHPIIMPALSLDYGLDRRCIIKEGPYVLNLTYYGLCPGVKLLKTQAMAYVEQETKEKYVAITNITYVNSVHLETIKILVYRGSDEANVLWKYVVKKPCEHPVCAPILNKSYGTDHRCMVKEGQYHIKMSVTDLIPASFLGDQFFYGEFTYKVTISAKKYPVVCIITRCMFTKK